MNRTTCLMEKEMEGNKSGARQSIEDATAGIQAKDDGLDKGGSSRYRKKFQRYLRGKNGRAGKEFLIRGD